ncbi:MAG: putative porin [Marinifilaceae bacterium]|jgi:hypothetical protein|nr:putative porin [Marinifilaceae bacterium]
MKEKIVVIILLLIGSSVFAQTNQNNNFGMPQENLDAKHNEEEHKNDTLGYGDVKSRIRTWRISKNHIGVDSIHIDSSLFYSQNYNPIFKKAISNSYLGNLGSAYISNIFINRENTNNIFLDKYRAYIKLPEDFTFYNTTTPFTKLSFETGGPKGRSENLVHILHTQNITPEWNAGVVYDLISADGQYQNQKTNIYNMGFFTSYKKDRYGLNLVTNVNRGTIEENGGIANDTLLTNTSDKSENIQVNLENSNTKIINVNLLLNHSYGVGNAQLNPKGKDTIVSYPLNLVHSLNYRKDSWAYKEDVADKEFYKNTYLSENTFDKVDRSLIKNTFRIVFHESKWTNSKTNIGISNEFETYRQRKEISKYSLAIKERKLDNTSLIAGFEGKLKKLIDWNFNLDYSLIGYRNGELKANGYLLKSLKKDSINNTYVKAYASIDKLKSSPIYDEYFGNHQTWKNNFDKQTELKLGVEFFAKKINLGLKLQANLLKNYIYWNQEALPTQANEDIMIYSAVLNKDFKAGNFCFSQKLVGQSSSKSDLINLPDLSVYSDNYYYNDFFGGALDIKTGFSVRYNTEFYAPAYMPSNGQFYNQKIKKLADYPKIDIYFNFRIKRTRLFIMMENLNSSFGTRDYFSSLHYPINQRMLKYGLVWNFYD